MKNLCSNLKTHLVNVVVSMSLVNEDGVTSNGVMMQTGGNVARFSGDSNFDANDVASNSSGVVRKIGTCKIRNLITSFSFINNLFISQSLKGIEKLPFTN